MKWIAAIALIAIAATGWTALAQGPAAPPPSGPGASGDPEMASLTTDIVVLRAINNINATPEQLRKLADLLGDLSDAERALREQAIAELTKERERLLAAKPGENVAVGEGLKAIRSSTEEFRGKIRDTETKAEGLLDADQMKAFRGLLAMTRGERSADSARDRTARPKGAGPGQPEANGPQRPGAPPPPPAPGADNRSLRERLRDRIAKGEGFQRPPVPLERVVELIREKIDALAAK
jgi:hypothetical protein